MKLIKKNNFLAIALMLFIVFSTIYVSYRGILFVDETELALQIEKPYLIEKLEYIDSFVIPEVTTSNEFDTLLNYQPTAATIDTQTIVNSITKELNDSFNPDINHSLPLLAHWNSGDIGFNEGMTPDYVISLIEEGNHILPSWKLEPYWATQLQQEYYESSILRAKELNLPLTFIIDPFENTFIDDAYYFSFTSESNPNVVDINSNILTKVSPFGSDTLWSEIAKNHANNSMLQLIQGWYPNPPLVMFVDNKSTNKLSWNEVNTSKRYVDRYSNNENDTFKRTLVGAQWIEKYRVLHEDFKNTLLSDTWRNNTKFISYNSISLDIGSSDTWHYDSTITNHYFSVWPQTSDATNVEYVTDGTLESLNNIIFNVNNLNFLLKEAHKSNNDYTHQISISDNNTYQTLDAYRGFSQLALWMVRPSIIREFTHESNDKTVILPKYQAIIDSVELIHNDITLEKFWKNGKLVENNNTKIEQLINVPLVYSNSSKWFLLDVNVNPVAPWTSNSVIPVYAIALKIGEAPNRDWLILAQSLSGALENITVTIPNYGNVNVSSSIKGNFYVISENAVEEVTAIVEKVVTPVTEQIALGNGTTYYFDATNGNDSNNGTSESSAWKTLNMIKGLNLQPGDNILFKRGEIWNATRLINYNYPSGTQENYILFSSYGDENAARPIISSLTKLDIEWIEEGNNIWRSKTNLNRIDRLQNNGIEILKARNMEELSSGQPWHHDGLNTLFVYSTMNPSSYTFTYSPSITFYLSDQNYIIIDSLDIRGGNSSSIYLKGSSNIKITNCKIGLYASYGIYANNSFNNPVVNNIIIQDSIIDSGFILDYSWVTPGGAGSDYIASSDGIYFSGGVTESIIENNFIKNWNHASISLSTTSSDPITDNEIFNNTLTAPDVAYGGRFGMSGVNVFNNEIHHNIIKDTSVRSQLNGHNNHFHHNIIDGVKNSHIKRVNLGQCFSMEAYNGNVYENLFEFNTFKNCEGAAIRLIATGRADRYIKDNIFRNNDIKDCGLNTTDGSAETDIYIEDYIDIKGQVFEANSISSSEVKHKAMLLTVPEFNTYEGHIDNISAEEKSISVGVENIDSVGSTINY